MAERYQIGEVGEARHRERHQAVRLPETLREDREVPLRADQVVEVLDDALEAADCADSLDCFSVRERHRLDLVAVAHEAVAEVGLEADPIEVERGQPATLEWGARVPRPRG